MEEHGVVPEKKLKQSNPFRFAEKCLYDYKKNLARLEVLRGDLQILKDMPSVKVQDYDFDDIILSVGGHSDPVAARLVRMEQLEKEIAWLERRTVPIMRFVEDIKRTRPVAGSLKADFLTLLRMLYIEEMNQDAVIKKLGMGRTAFYKKKRAMINEIKQYLGL